MSDFRRPSGLAWGRPRGLPTQPSLTLVASLWCVSSFAAFLRPLKKGRRTWTEIRGMVGFGSAPPGGLLKR